FAHNMTKSRTGRVVAVGSRSQASADKFADEFKIGARHSSYQALIDDPAVKAVYICTPHPMHAELAIAACAAGKHVLCEKPMTLNWAEAMAVFEAAEVAGVMVMEAFMYRCHPQTAKLVELLKNKAIGEVRYIQSNFGFHTGFNENSRLWSSELAGGGLMDVGCYAASGARLVAGAAMGHDFANPVQVTGVAKLAPTGVDAIAAATLKFPGNIVAQLVTTLEFSPDNSIRIFGSEGTIFVPDPWAADRQNPKPGKIVINKSGKSEEIIIEADQTSFTYEIDVFGDAVLSGKTEPPAPAMTRGDTLGNLRTLDQWRSAVGVQFAAEKPATFRKTTYQGRPLAVRKNNMRYGRIPLLDRDVSRLIMGCDNQQNLSHAAIMFDDYFERGGNTFDTAFIYGGGSQEKLLGQWIKLRGVRDQINVIGKGCHTPMADPRSLTWQLETSLQRLQLDGVDIYMMHRDNLDVPVSEFIDVLNEHVKAGRIKVFGGSNWSLERVQAANEYAASKSLQGFSVVSNNFSLARMVDPVWAGCISASDPASRAWFAKSQLALLSWSSQARGFFVPDRAAPEKTEDSELVRSWYSPDNFVRLERAKEIAARKNVTSINVALAYVLAQPFPTFALIGPRELSETRTSLPGLDVTLTPEEVAYLSND
ncbi:MAG TPA: aldo/keto reductase, partial [Tepidisphaeraceae bacterium]